MNYNNILPSGQSYQPAIAQIIPQTGSAFAFRINGLRTSRPKGMYIDMNSGKGCGSCGKSAK